MRIVPGKNLEQQKKSVPTAKRKRKHNGKQAKPTDKEKALFMSQSTFVEVTVEKDVPLCDTKEGAIKLTKGVTKLPFK